MDSQKANESISLRELWMKGAAKFDSRAQKDIWLGLMDGVYRGVPGYELVPNIGMSLVRAPRTDSIRFRQGGSDDSPVKSIIDITPSLDGRYVVIRALEDGPVSRCVVLRGGLLETVNEMVVECEHLNNCRSDDPSITAA